MTNGKEFITFEKSRQAIISTARPLIQTISSKTLNFKISVTLYTNRSEPYLTSPSSRGDLRVNMQQTDQELISRYLKGDESSLQILINRHQRKIFTSIYLLVKERELADDIFQETFIKVINTLRSGNYNEEGKFLSWVLRIAHNLVIDHFRSLKRMPMVHDTEEYCIFDTIPLSDDNVEDKIIQEQIQSTLRRLIEELPYDQREVVIMRHYGNMSFKEIARCTNVSINTSLGRMRYALINLRKLIRQKQLILTRS